MADGYEGIWDQFGNFIYIHKNFGWVKNQKFITAKRNSDVKSAAVNNSSCFNWSSHITKENYKRDVEIFLNL